MYIDFDGFKNINDTYGHDIGDLALIEGVKRLKSAVRQDDLVARVGGDEFVVLLNNLSDKFVAERIAKDMIRLFEEPFLLNGCQTEMGISIGIVVNNGFNDAEEIIKSADEAMYIVKNSTKNNYHFTNIE